jgi:kynurenine formamidase
MLGGRWQASQTLTLATDRASQTQEAVEWLIHERAVLGFAVETINIDAGQSASWPLPFPCHALMLGAGLYGLQCLRGLDQLPPTGALLVAAPLKIKGGSGSPTRVIALVPPKQR